MRDKGIEIVVALLEKRESILVTKDSGQSFVKELLRAESLGYAQKESRDAIFTLSEKGRRLVNSGYNFEETDNPDPDLPVFTPYIVSNGLYPQPADNSLSKERQKELFTLKLLKAALFLVAILIICFIGVNMGVIQIL
jgi:predicted transcriptional regulator